MTRLRGITHRSIGVQAIALAASTGIAQAILAVIYVFTARSAAPSDFGLVVNAVAIGTTAVGFLDFGTNSYWVRELASNRLDASVLGQRLASKLLYSAAGFGAWTAATLFLVPSSNLWMAGPVGMSVVLSQSFQVPLRGLGRGDLAAVATLVDKTVAGAVFLALLSTGVAATSALWLCLSAGGLSSALLCWRLTPQPRRAVLVLRRTTNPWSASSHYGIASVAITAQSLDIPALTVFGGASSVGIYAAVSRWTQPMGLLANAFSSASAPHIARAHSAREAWDTARKSIWLLGVAMGLSLVTAIFAPFIVETLIGPNYVGSADVLRILALSTVVSIANQPLYVFLQARGFDKPIALITVLTVVIHLSLVSLLSTNIHALGAAVASLCTQIVLFLSMGTLLANRWGQMRTRVKTIERESAKAK
jgi:O-antigen/teichoic acid export membrane protein